MLHHQPQTSMIEDFDALKHCVDGPPRYRLSRANVHVSPGGFHYIDYLDPVAEIDPTISGDSLTSAEITYIEQQLQSNEERFAGQIAAVQRHTQIAGKRVLDIGCGGGLFLAKMRAAGALVMGVELSDTRAAYAAHKHGLEIVKRPIEDAYWLDHAGRFDIVTLWDVIEHVNYPVATLKAAVRLLRPGGFLLIDTPCRDAFYHRAGEITYRLSRGRLPTFLNAMYSAHPFGHKQIFSTTEMRRMFESLGCDVLDLRKFHELSFPKLFYLRKLFRSETLAKAALPVVAPLLAVFPIRNKMLVVGQRPVSS